jgi:hypothetical protein
MQLWDLENRSTRIAGKPGAPYQIYRYAPLPPHNADKILYDYLWP